MNMEWSGKLTLTNYLWSPLVGANHTSLLAVEGKSRQLIRAVSFQELTACYFLAQAATLKRRFACYTKKC